jgi:hypothetical protein
MRTSLYHDQLCRARLSNLSRDRYPRQHHDFGGDCGGAPIAKHAVKRDVEDEIKYAPYFDSTDIADLSCLRALWSASARSLALLRKVPFIIRSVTTRVERGFADFAQIPYEDVSHRELCEFLDEFEGCALDEPSVAGQRTTNCCTPPGSRR